MTFNNMCEGLKLIFSHRLKGNNLINLVGLQAKKQYFFIPLKGKLWILFIISSALIIFHDQWEKGFRPTFHKNGPYSTSHINCKQVN